MVCSVFCVLVVRFSVLSICIGWFSCMVFSVIYVDYRLVECLNRCILMCLVWLVVRFLKLVGIGCVCMVGMVSVRVSVIVSWVRVGVDIDMRVGVIDSWLVCVWVGMVGGVIGCWCFG